MRLFCTSTWAWWPVQEDLRGFINELRRFCKQVRTAFLNSLEQSSTAPSSVDRRSVCTQLNTFYRHISSVRNPCPLEVLVVEEVVHSNLYYVRIRHLHILYPLPGAVTDTPQSVLVVDRWMCTQYTVSS